jgi:hypothetical protein
LWVRRCSRYVSRRWSAERAYSIFQIALWWTICATARGTGETAMSAAAGGDQDSSSAITEPSVTAADTVASRPAKNWYGRPLAPVLARASES